MRVYNHDDAPGDCRLPHQQGEDLGDAELTPLGILFYHFPVDDGDSRTKVDALAKDRGYAHRDEITVSPQAMGGAYEEKIDMFFREHIHEDEEIRYILHGTGYFDVRNHDDRWLRIRTEPGDLIILPAGIYHRFTVDEDNFIQATRLFQTNPKWAALYRSDETEGNGFRKSYLKTRAEGYSK